MIAALGALAILAGAGVAPASAKPIEHTKFNDEFSDVSSFCEVSPVRIEIHDRGVIVGRETGPGRLPRYTITHHGGGAFTNVSTYKAFTIGWNYVNQDVRVTDNGDGTLSVLYQAPGPERWYGPNGEIVSTSGGTIRFLVLLDHRGTPSDPSDDVFISEEFVSEAGGKPQNVDLCAEFRTRTA